MEIALVLTWCLLDAGLATAQDSQGQAYVLLDEATEVHLDMAGDALAGQPRPTPRTIWSMVQLQGSAESATSREFSISLPDPYGINNPDYPGQPGLCPIGTVSCSLRADNPHKGRTSGTVKAKAEGGCGFTWTGPCAMPPDDAFQYVLQMLLARAGAPSEGKIGWFPQSGPHPSWPPNAVGTKPGTQVDSNICVNDNWTNVASISLYMIPPWVYSGPDPIVSASKSAEVSKCY